MKIDAPHVDAVLAERMEVGVAFPAPIDEFDTQLERGLGGLHELVFPDAENPVEIDDVGYGRFADADGADFIGFDERDRHILRVEQAG